MLLLILAYVVFGGALGASYVGIMKIILMAGTLFTCGILGLHLVGGWNALWTSPELPHDVYFSLIGRGFGKDVGAGMSLVLGVLTEQAYIQALLSARSLKNSRKGALLAASLGPLIGGAGVLVGMSMRVTHPGINSALALPLFILDYLPGALAGAMLAALLVALVGSGAGLSLGISTVLTNDLLLPNLRVENSEPKKALKITRTVLVGVLLVAALIAISDASSMIMSWSFLSMGLRGAVAFSPLMAALFLRGKIRVHFAVTAMLAGPIGTFAGKYLLPDYLDPVWLGVGAAVLIMLIGLLVGKRSKPTA
jgi:SSS family solute:Na+ symporter